MTTKIKKSFLDDYPELEKDWHKDNIIDPYTLTSGSHYEVKWNCKCGEIYKSQIKTKINGAKKGNLLCKKCNLSNSNKNYYNNKNNDKSNKMEIIHTKHKSVAETFPILLKYWHFSNEKTLYEYKPFSVKIGKWICINCEKIWETTIRIKVSSLKKEIYSCIECSSKNRSKQLSICEIKKSVWFLLPQFILEWNFKLNERNLYNCALNSNYKAYWICKNCSYEWKAEINHRVNIKTGCPKCVNISKGEKQIAEILDNLDIKYKQQYKFEKCKNITYLPFDFYIPNLNFLIEFDSIQHFKPIELFGGHEGFKKCQNNDKIKNKFCAQNNIHLLRIKYDENIERVLKIHIEAHQIRLDL